MNRKNQTRNPVTKMNGRACGSALEVCLRQLMVLLLMKQGWECSSSGTAALLLPVQAPPALREVRGLKDEKI